MFDEVRECVCIGSHLAARRAAQGCCWARCMRAWRAACVSLHTRSCAALLKNKEKGPEDKKAAKGAFPAPLGAVCATSPFVSCVREPQGVSCVREPQGVPLYPHTGWRKRNQLTTAFANKTYAIFLVTFSYNTCTVSLTQVGGGANDFYPSPSESRSIISTSYAVSPTLVVRFSDDSIDESAEIVGLLRQRMGAGERGGGGWWGLAG